MNVAITAGYVAHLRPKYLAEMPRQGLYTAGRRIRFTMRFHRFPQKSCKEEQRYGSLNCGSSSKPRTARARAATMRRIISRKRYISDFWRFSETSITGFSLNSSLVEGKHEELEAGEPGDEEGGDAAEMDGVEGERNEEKEKDYREEKQQPGKANGSHFCSEETVGERETISELVVEQTIDDQDYL
nr:hypothetical protein JCGZ_00984 [Ipomoea batatas]